MKTHAAVFTYRRPQLLSPLLTQLARYPIDVHVFDDDPASDQRHTQHYVAPRNHGKEQFWAWVTFAMKQLEQTDAERFVFLPDDISLCANFLGRCETRWASLPAGAASLNLLVDHRHQKANWTGKKPERYNAMVEETWWVDGCFYADRTMFDALDWRIDAIDPARWRCGRKHAGVPPGSGVWSQATQRLFKAGRRMFRSYHSLVLNHGHTSLMNPVGRRAFPAATIRWIDEPT